MNTIHNGKNFGIRLVGLKEKFYDFTRRFAIRDSKKKEYVSLSDQDRIMPNREMSSRVEQFNNERPTEWASQIKNTDNGLVDMREKYVLRPRLSWTGLYGKVPWPRERKEWQKV